MSQISNVQTTSGFVDESLQPRIMAASFDCGKSSKTAASAHACWYVLTWWPSPEYNPSASWLFIMARASRAAASVCSNPGRTRSRAQLRSARPKNDSRCLTPCASVKKILCLSAPRRLSGALLYVEARWRFVARRASKVRPTESSEDSSSSNGGGASDSSLDASASEESPITTAGAASLRGWAEYAEAGRRARAGSRGSQSASSAGAQLAGGL
mmetsp:Transcript_14922/g.51275  ORF Transcript_14922/g.51275 Transcript_14922/m.51275 type:complete len:213 (+) Transcript_14922:832-1470(+)